MHRLLSGYEKLKTDVLEKNPELYESLKNGQTPEFLVLSCIDSRVNPTTLFQAKDGLFLQSRNAGNIVHHYDQSTTKGLSFASALQFAVEVLQVKEVIVLGHSQCGGIHKLLTIHDKEPEPDDLVGEWVRAAAPAAKEAIEIAKKTGEDVHITCEKQNVLNSIRNLMTYPFVEEAIKAGKLGINGFYLHVGYESLEILDKKQGRFVTVPSLRDKKTG